MDAYGAFNLLRLPIGLMYYVAPVWAWQPGGHYWMQDTILRLTSGMELPPSSVLLTDPLTLSLALAGLAHTIRARRPLASLGEAAPILAGLAVPAFLMLIFIGMNFRYRAEFEPLLACGACLAAAGWSERLRGAPSARLRRVAIVLGLLCALQVVSAELHSIVVLFSPFGQVEKAAPAGMFSYYGYELDLLRGVGRGGRLGPI
jgi:hypothetical protein